MVENSYDSELEAEFFGTKDPDANEKAFGELEKLVAEKESENEKEMEEKKAKEIHQQKEAKTSKEILVLEASNK